MIKSLKNHKIIYMILVFVVALGAALWVTAETENPGKINLTKTATKVYESDESSDEDNNLQKGRYAKVTLDVNANPYNYDEHTTGKVDIVLVLDGSGSMADDANGKSTNKDSERRITGLKNSATSFINTIMDDKGNVKIGLVEYSTKVEEGNSQELTDNKQTALNFIENMEADGATNLQSGIAKANEILSNGRSDAKKLVVILTDGVPTKFNYTKTSYDRRWVSDGVFSGHYEYTPVTTEEIAGSGYNNNAVNICYETERDNDYRCASGKSASVRPSEAAKAELDTLKSNYPTADVYTITFGNEKEAATILAEVNPVSAENETPIYKNLTALDGDALKDQFDTIAEATQNLIGKNSAVTDVIPADFELTANSKAALEEQGVVVTENSDGTTTLTWTIGNINAGTDYNLSYEVKAKDDYHGSMYTNDNATLTTTVNNDNPYYKNETNKTLTLDFEKPTVEIPAITSDDHYSNNSSYQGYAEATLNGTSILTNDKLANVMVDGTNVKVEDKIVINENDNTKKVANTTNKYEIYKNNVKQGTLTINEDGTFTFVSEEGISGEVEFTYHIESTINPNHETNKVISNDSKVTLNILERSKVNTTGELTVTKVWSDGENQDGLRTDSVSVTLTADGKDKETVELNAGNEWTYTFTGLYQYEVGKEGQEDGKITYTVKETNVPTGYTASVTGDVAKGFTVTNSHTPELINNNSGKLTVTKVWSDEENQDGLRTDSVSVTLTADGKDKETVELNAGNEWTYTFKDLPQKANGQDIEYKVVENSVPTGYTASVTGDVAKGFTVTNSHTPELINNNSGKLTVTKVWSDEENQDGLRTDSVSVSLTADGKDKETVELNAGNEWTYTFKDLPQKANGQDIEYKVVENSVPTGYTASVTGDVAKGFTVTNSHTPELINNNSGKLTVTKVWSDEENQDGLRTDSVSVTLTADGKDKETVELNAGNEWTYTFKDLPQKANGQDIEYKVVENSVPTGYTASVTGDVAKGFTVTNSHTPELINNNSGKLTVTKVWSDEENQDGLRTDSVSVTLTADGKDKETVELNAGNEWTYTFKDLPQKANGQDIEYKVVENSVPTGYTASVTGDVAKGFTVTNSHTPELINNNSGKLTVTKVWSDEENQDGLRTDSVSVSLTADGKDKETVELNAGNEWTYTFKDLPQKANGQDIEYKVVENSVPTGYTASVTGDVAKGFTVTNSHTPELINNNSGKLTVTKVWSDEENQDGLRTDSVSVTLTADGKDKETVELNAGNEWTYTFKDLPQKANGQDIEYKVVENSVPTGYTASVTGDVAKGYTITNSHTPELINGNGNLTITKEWLDVGYDKRPTSVVLTLQDIIEVNGVKDVKEVGDATLTKNDNWTYTFKDLPKYRNGQEIDYQLVEKEIDENYTFSYDKNTDENGITSLIGVNTIKELKRPIPVTKVWDDKDDQDGLRPNEENEKNKDITVTLTGIIDGVTKYEDTITITGNNTDKEWYGVFKDVPTFIDGKLVSYDISEADVEGYKIGYAGDTNGYTITNTHTPDTTSVKGYKKWDDNNNQDGKRPKNITINLIADGDKDNPVAHVDLDGNDTTIVDEEGNWTFEFTDLPTYRDHGTEIIYTVEEVQTDELKEYYTATQGTVTTEDGLVMNTITNSHTPMTISYELTKNWDDFDDQYNNRPDSITVTLTGTVEELNYSFTKTIEVTAANGWKYTFPDLDKYYKGHLIQYTIEETAVPGYNTEPIVQIENVEDESVYSTEINNTPETTEITVTKTWDDEDNLEGLRPEKIAVDLYANGEFKETFYITSADDWKTILSGLPKYYDHGKLVKYTLFEHAVDGYVTIIDGFNILNRHELGKGTGIDDVEVLPPHTGIIEISSTNNNTNILEFILSLIMIIPLTLNITKKEER